MVNKYIFEIGCKVSKNFADMQIKNAELVFSGAFAHGIAVVELAVDVLLGSDQSGFGQLFVVARDFDLLAVFGHFFEVVVKRGKLLKLFFEVVAHGAGDLVSAFGNDADGFVDVAGGLGEFHQVAGYGVKRSVSFRVVHFAVRCILVVYVFACNGEDIIGLFAVGAVGVVVDEGVVFIDHFAEAFFLALVD